MKLICVRWVYLEGIFTGSADIPHLLPVESQRFASISSEFLQLMKKVNRIKVINMLICFMTLKIKQYKSLIGFLM